MFNRSNMKHFTQYTFDVIFNFRISQSLINLKKYLSLEESELIESWLIAYWCVCMHYEVRGSFPIDKTILPKNVTQTSFMEESNVSLALKYVSFNYRKFYFFIQLC